MLQNQCPIHDTLHSEAQIYFSEAVISLWLKLFFKLDYISIFSESQYLGWFELNVISKMRGGEREGTRYV